MNTPLVRKPQLSRVQARCVWFALGLAGCGSDGAKTKASQEVVAEAGEDGSKIDAGVPSDAGVETFDAAGDGGKPTPPFCDCPPEHPCIDGTCDCTNPDVDGDRQPSTVCGGTDCNDNDPAVYDGAEEVCDEANVDEDCDVETVGERDLDGDGYVDHKCANVDADSGRVVAGEDCDDADRATKPGVPEVCDYIDNDCDGLIDEDADGVAHGARETFVPDEDEDGFGNHEGEPLLACLFPRKYVPLASGPSDPDDSDPDIFPEAREICDGKDNDGDGAVDGEDADFVKHIEFTNTTVECIDGHLEITECPDDTRWCPDRYTCPDGSTHCDTKIERGCDVDETRRSSCRACATNCSFACGAMGCDEVVQISVGFQHACAVMAEGGATCWGRGSLGQIGNDRTIASPTADRVLGLAEVQEVVAGPRNSCAIVGPERALYCWGDNSEGQLGNFTVVEVGGFSAVPVAVLSGEVGLATDADFLTGVVGVDIASSHICAVLDLGVLVCWGQQEAGRLGNQQEGEATVEQPVFALDAESNIIFDAAGVTLRDRGGCIQTTGGGVRCWGDNTEGALGYDPAEVSGSSALLPVPELVDITDIDSGFDHVCVLSRGEVLCWGLGAQGQLGRGLEQARDHTPAPVRELSRASALAIGDYHGCALTDEGLSCWGSNAFGQLGNDLDPGDGVPHLVSDVGTHLSGLAAGSGSTCVVVDQGASRCWGANGFGQLGIGPRYEQAIPTPTNLQPLSGSVP